MLCRHCVKLFNQFVIDYSVLAGTYYSDEGGFELAQCTDCPAGYACEQYGIAIPSTLCSAGHYCTEGANTSQPVNMPFGDLCPPG